MKTQAFFTFLIFIACSNPHKQEQKINTEINKPEKNESIQEYYTPAIPNFKLDSNKYKFVEEIYGLKLPPSIIVKSEFKGQNWKDLDISFKLKINKTYLKDINNSLENSTGFQCDNSPPWRINFNGKLGKQKGIWKCQAPLYSFYSMDPIKVVSAYCDSDTTDMINIVFRIEK